MVEFLQNFFAIIGVMIAVVIFATLILFWFFWVTDKFERRRTRKKLDAIRNENKMRASRKMYEIE